MEQDGVRLPQLIDRRDRRIDQADLVADPGRHQRDAGDRCRCRIDEVGELFAADLQAVGNGAHRVADDERVRVVVEEDRESEPGGTELRAARVVRKARDVIHDAQHAARARDDPDHSADREGEDDDRCVVRVGERTHHVDLHGIEQPGPDRIERAAIHRSGTEPETEEQGWDDLAKHQSSCNRDQRWHDRDEAGARDRVRVFRQSNGRQGDDEHRGERG